MDTKETILVTGGTGYIASWIITYLLEAGHTVHITVRNKNKTERYAHLTETAEKTDGTLKVFSADLLNMGAFDEAMQGCSIVMHTASPFIVDQVSDSYKEIVQPAIDGTKNVLESVNKTDSVKRVVLTSSVVGIYGDPIDVKKTATGIFTEKDWNTSSTAEESPYAYSKVAAEKKAWEIHDAQSRWKLVVVNPGFVFGPSLTKHAGSASIKFIKRLGDGTYRTGIPEIWTTAVDVRDVAKAHILAAFKENAEGRHALVSDAITFVQIADILKNNFKGYAFPMMTAPKWLMWVIAPAMGVTREFVSRNVGYPFSIDNTKSKEALGLTYRPLETTLVEHFQQLIDDKII